jgi:hypothetical protein
MDNISEMYDKWYRTTILLYEAMLTTSLALEMSCTVGNTLDTN